MTPAYRRLLDKIFGKYWKAGHELVEEWHEKLNREANSNG
jgi:hypothetical protein